MTLTFCLQGVTVACLATVAAVALCVPVWLERWTEVNAIFPKTYGVTWCVDHDLCCCTKLLT
jgi:hypothetical protein